MKSEERWEMRISWIVEQELEEFWMFWKTVYCILQSMVKRASQYVVILCYLVFRYVPCYIGGQRRYECSAGHSQVESPSPTVTGDS